MTDPEPTPDVSFDEFVEPGIYLIGADGFARA